MVNTLQHRTLTEQQPNSQNKNTNWNWEDKTRKLNTNITNNHSTEYMQQHKV
jgi:hypothetical protein